MNIKNLHTMFNPGVIAVIGASGKASSVGYALFKNLIGNGFNGTVYPVNPRHTSIQGVKCYPGVSSIPDPVDLAIVAVPAGDVIDVVNKCGEAGIRSIVIVSAGFKESGAEGKNLSEELNGLVKKYDMSILGPNCLGFIHPKINLNASFARKMPVKGGIAFISQSGALGTAVLDWATHENVGFSYFVSLGDMTDIGYHDLIDYFGSDENTSSILIYMESLNEARKFMSAARGFARTKPILVLKSGKSREGASAALSHTGSITGNDQIFDAAFKRVGILRVNTISELFDCAKTLSMQERPGGNRLAIVTNAGGPGVIATDVLIALKGKLAALSGETFSYLDECLPESWSKSNPVDILGDADPVRFEKAISACVNDVNVDGVLVILTPQAMTDSVAIAKTVIDISGRTSKTILTAWMGEDDVVKGRKLLETNGIPSYQNPEEAIRTFVNMCLYDDNLELLYETPATIPHAFTPGTEESRQIVDKVFSEDRLVFTEPEAKKLLSNYDIQVPRGFLAKTKEESLKYAETVGYPVVMKVVSPEIVHKIDIGGVVTNINNSSDIESAYDKVMQSVKDKSPQVNIEGVYIEEMVSKKYELLIGCKKDDIFGPAIVFGMGGIAVEIFKDTNIGLPPLNMALSQRLIEGTKIYQLLKGYRGMDGIDIDAVRFLLYKFAYLVMDFPEIKEIDINPFAIDSTGGLVLDAKVILDGSTKGKAIKPYSHMVISPYPREYEKNAILETGESILLRPIRPEDEPMEAEMFKTFSSETQRFRFFGPVKSVTHEMLIRYTQIDYDREIAIIAEQNEASVKKMLGVVRVIADPYNRKAEFAIVVGDPWQRRGLGTKMMEHMLQIVKNRGIKNVYAYTLLDNSAMLKLFERFGFSRIKQEDMYRLELEL